MHVGSCCGCDTTWSFHELLVADQIWDREKTGYVYVFPPYGGTPQPVKLILVYLKFFIEKLFKLIGSLKDEVLENYNNIIEYTVSYARTG